jgi:hypothetical protein
MRFNLYLSIALSLAIIAASVRAQDVLAGYINTFTVSATDVTEVSGILVATSSTTMDTSAVKGLLRISGGQSGLQYMGILASTCTGNSFVAYTQGASLVQIAFPLTTIASAENFTTLLAQSNMTGLDIAALTPSNVTAIAIVDDLNDTLIACGTITAAGAGDAAFASFISVVNAATQGVSSYVGFFEYASSVSGQVFAAVTYPTQSYSATGAILTQACSTVTSSVLNATTGTFPLSRNSIDAVFIGQGQEPDAIIPLAPSALSLVVFEGTTGAFTLEAFQDLLKAPTISNHTGGSNSTSGTGSSGSNGPSSPTAKTQSKNSAMTMSIQMVTVLMSLIILLF